MMIKSTFSLSIGKELLASSLSTLDYISSKRFIRSYTTTIGVYNNIVIQLINIIQNPKTLTTYNKTLFRDFWKFSENNINVSNGLREVEIKDQFSLVQKVGFDSFIEFVKITQSETSITRGLYRRELLYHSNDNVVANKLLNALISNGSLNTNMNSRSEIFYWCLNESIKTGDNIMAFDLYLLYYSINPYDPLDEVIASKLLSLITFNDPKFNYLYLQKYILLSSLFKKKGRELQLTRFQLYTLSNTAFSLKDNRVISKKALRILMNVKLLDDDKLRNDQLTLIYELIDRDYKINNPAGVFHSWLKIKNQFQSLELHDPRVIFKIFKICHTNRSYRNVCKEILARLPPAHYCNNPLLLPLIFHFITDTHSLQDAKKIIEDMRKYTTANVQEVLWCSERYLGALFKMQLNFHDYESSDQVMKRITTLFGNLSHANYQAISSQLINSEKTENIMQAIQLLDTLPTKVSILLYPTLINKLIEWEISGQNIVGKNAFALINELLTKAHRGDPNHLSSFWNILPALYIKYLVSFKNRDGKSINIAEGDSRHPPVYKVRKKLSGFNLSRNLDLAKYLYINSHNTNKNAESIESYNPFAVSDPRDVHIRITRSNKLVILKNIAMSAINFKRKDIFLWCCSCLYKQGIPVDELTTDWNIRLKHQIRRSDYETIDVLEDNVQKQGLKMIEAALR